MASNNAYGPQIANGGLVCHLDANNAKSYPGAGTKWYDLSGKGNHFDLINGPTFSTDSNGVKHITFDGGNDYGNCVRNAGGADFPVAAEARTVEAWFTKNNDSSSNAHKGIFGWGASDYEDAYFLEHNYNQAFLYCYGSADLGPTGPVFTDNKFYHIAATYDGVISKLWLNGALLTSETRTLSTVDSDVPTIAHDGGYNSGYIDMVRVYTRVLTRAELMQNFNAHRARFGL